MNTFHFWGGLFVMILNLFSGTAQAGTPQVGQPAPNFTLKTHEGEDFSLESRRGKGWTILYFYPKADTPGCTKQACAFRDSLKQITDLNATVYGVSADTVEEQAAFHKKHHLNFPLLADAKGEVIALYDTKMPLVSFSKRWTFLIDPQLTLRHIEKGVDPVKDAPHMAELLKKFQSEPTPH